MIWLSLISRYKYIIGIGLAVFLLITWGFVHGEQRYKQGFQDGSSEAIIACQSASQKAQATSSKKTRAIVQTNRNQSSASDIDWLTRNGLFRTD